MIQTQQAVRPRFILQQWTCSLRLINRSVCEHRGVHTEQQDEDDSDIYANIQKKKKDSSALYANVQKKKKKKKDDDDIYANV